MSDRPGLEELLGMLDEMNKSFDNLPLHAQMSFVTHCDLNAALLLIAQIFKVSRERSLPE